MFGYVRIRSKQKKDGQVICFRCNQAGHKQNQCTTNPRKVRNTVNAKQWGQKQSWSDTWSRQGSKRGSGGQRLQETKQQQERKDSKGSAGSSQDKVKRSSGASKDTRIANLEKDVRTLNSQIREAEKDKKILQLQVCL